MKVLITGSTGVLGMNLVEYLCQKGLNQLRLIDLAENSETIRSDHVFYQADVRDKSTLEKVIPGVDVVVHCASATPAYEEKDVFDINVQGTKNLLEVCYDFGIKRFVYISSTSVYGIPDKSPVHEYDPVKPFDPYNKSKIMAEELCLEYRRLGMIIPILRPRTFVGPWRLGTFSMLFEWASEKKHFPIIGKGINRYQFLDVEDLCEAIYLCITKQEEKVNDTFNIGAKEFKNFYEDYQAVLDAAGFGKKIIRLPLLPARLILQFLAFLKVIPIYKRLYEKLNMDYFVSVKKAEKKLGFTPRYSNQESLIRAYNWYLKNNANLKLSEGLSNACPWKQGALKLCKIFF